MKHTRFASLAIGGLALGLSLFGITGCQDTPTDAASTTAVASDQLYSIFKVDQTALAEQDMLPSFDEAMEGCVVAGDGALLLPPPPKGDDRGGRGKDDSTHRGGGRDTVRNGGGPAKDDSAHHGGGRDTVRNGGGRGKDDTTHQGGGRDTVRRDPPRRDSAILNVRSLDRLLHSLPGMNDSLLRTIMPCFRDYRATVDGLQRRFITALRDLRTEFNKSVRALRNDSTLTAQQKREAYNALKLQFQNAAVELKRGLDAALKVALTDLIQCIGQYLNDEQLAAFRAGLERLG